MTGWTAKAARVRSWMPAGWRPLHYAVLALVNAHLLASGSLAGGRDWRTVFYPWADALRLSIVRYHQFPWWNPWPISGQPLFADPQAPVLVPDTLLLLAFGSVAGFKLAILLYEVVGYEGCRALCRELFGKSRFVEAISIIPAIIPALSLHWSEGHIVFVVFLLFPWVLVLALTWQRSTWRALALGVLLAWHFLGYIHYSLIMSFTLAGPLAARGLWRGIRSGTTWARAALVLTTALGLSAVRLGLTLTLLVHFPRSEHFHFPISFGLAGIIRTLVEPLQDRFIPIDVSGLHWWEFDSYVGGVALLLAFVGLRSHRRTSVPLVATALFCLALAWNNRDAPYPSYFLHYVRPWNHMVVITRWRLYACSFFLLAAVHALVRLHEDGKRVVARMLALLVVCDLAFNAMYGLTGTFDTTAPEWGDFDRPPFTVKEPDVATWENLRSNEVAAGALCPILGYGYHFPARGYVGDGSYEGDFPGVTVLRWTPNEIDLRGAPGSTVTLNMNPSSYWTMNGEQLFPGEKEIDIHAPFRVVVPPGGQMALRAVPPRVGTWIALQAFFAILAAILGVILWRGERRARGDLTAGDRGTR